MVEALKMGGYAFYVWSSVGLALAVFAWNVLSPAMQRRAVLERLADDDEDDGESVAEGSR